MSFKLIVSLILIGVVIVFIFQNTAVVDVRFLLWTVAMSRALLIIILLAIGIGLGWLLHGFRTRRRRRWL